MAIYEVIHLDLTENNDGTLWLNGRRPICQIKADYYDDVIPALVAQGYLSHNDDDFYRVKDTKGNGKYMTVAESESNRPICELEIIYKH